MTLQNLPLMTPHRRPPMAGEGIYMSVPWIFLEISKWLCINPQPQNRGLGVLERKGLIEFVERKRGARPVVNVC